jgi:2-polyprenyl-3-methyl-5-hydroxy-6-metoxy-1,4-benzoquinol methylase
MNELIKRFAAEADRDLMLCRSRGIAYQRDMTITASYDAAYFNKCRGYEDQEIALKINAGRIALVDKYVGTGNVLDVGIGSGEFIKKRGANTFGYDINPAAIAWLKRAHRWSQDFSAFRTFTFWDVIEHVELPENYLRAIAPGSHLFASIPVFEDIGRVRESKHYRPGEHLYYWTEQGFVDWIALYNFRLLERQAFETEAGRDSILSFAFCRDLPGYHETLAQYQKLHGNFYGSSAHLYFDLIAKEVLRLDPASVLDFGCGRSDLVAHFWNEGRRRIAKYDPAIPQFASLPHGNFDLAICTDVMEHIPMASVDNVLAEIRRAASNAIFTISLRPARAKLPDGRNAHVTLLTAKEWLRWIKSVFGAAIPVDTKWDHILMVKTFA